MVDKSSEENKVAPEISTSNLTRTFRLLQKRVDKLQDFAFDLYDLVGEFIKLQHRPEDERKLLLELMEISMRNSFVNRGLEKNQQDHFQFHSLSDKKRDYGYDKAEDSLPSPPLIEI